MNSYSKMARASLRSCGNVGHKKNEQLMPGSTRNLGGDRGENQDVLKILRLVVTKLLVCWFLFLKGWLRSDGPAEV